MAKLRRREALNADGGLQNRFGDIDREKFRTPVLLGALSPVPVKRSHDVFMGVVESVFVVVKDQPYHRHRSHADVPRSLALGNISMLSASVAFLSFATNSLGGGNRNWASTFF